MFRHVLRLVLHRSTNFQSPRALLRAQPIRFYTAASVPNTPRVPIQMTFQQVKRVLAKPDIVVIDVRDPSELIKDGRIFQGAKNIPLGKLEEALQLSDADFEQMYGFQKPGTKTTIVMHCKLGIRATKGAIALSKAGFYNVIVYPGTVDWVENGGELVQ